MAKYHRRKAEALVQGDTDEIPPGWPMRAHRGEDALPPCYKRNDGKLFFLMPFALFSLSFVVMDEVFADLWRVSCL